MVDKGPGLGRARRTGGFTLVEVLVAAAITVIIATIAYSSISQVLSSVEVLRENADRTQEINRAWMIISRDIAEFVPRDVRDEFGESEPALTGGEAARFMLSLTRAGWHNPNGHPRSNLQRINYRMEDEGLWRDTYYVLDRAGDTEPVSVELLKDVEYMELRFLSSLEDLEFESRSTNIDSSDWATDWVANVSQQGVQTLPPVALEIRLQLVDWGEMRRVYALPPL
jgi:general secretion pathway protein J